VPALAGVLVLWRPRKPVAIHATPPVAGNVGDAAGGTPVG
jgi:hypothetical protein